jgi:MinD superfamily P-loop ATPase
MKIAIVSGKCGTGKTTIATNLAKLINNSFYVDMDVEEPNGGLFLKPEIVNEENYNVMIPEINEDKCTYCGLCANNCAFNALSIIKSIKKTLFFEDLCH